MRVDRRDPKIHRGFTALQKPGGSLVVIPDGSDYDYPGLKHPFAILVGMTTVEEIATRVQALPEHLQQEALHYVEYLLQRQDAAREDREWIGACAAHLYSAYSDSDAAYDSE